MAEPRFHPPLFDRLAADAPRTLDRRGLRESVRRELELLFNTRSASPAHRLPGAPLTVLDYGIPALSDYSVRNPADHRALEAALLAAIRAFEPRLDAVRVRVVLPENDGMTLTVAIDADLAVNALREPVSFNVAIDPRQGGGTVHAQP